jgi:Flp pilus assembly protein TadG
MRDRTGAMAVEFAFVAPVFLVMLIGLIEFGRMFWIRSTIQFAVEETARYALVNPTLTLSDYTTYAATRLVGVSPASVDFSTNSSITSGSPDYLDLQATYTFQFMVPIIPLSPITLTAKSRVPLI